MNYWSLYFLISAALYYKGLIDFYWILNLILFLLWILPVPFKSKKALINQNISQNTTQDNHRNDQKNKILNNIKTTKSIILWICAIILMYIELKLPIPSFAQIKAIAGFDLTYILELVQRAISGFQNQIKNILIYLSFALLIYILLSRWLKMSSLTFLIVLSIPLLAFLQPVSSSSLSIAQHNQNNLNNNNLNLTNINNINNIKISPNQNNQQKQNDSFWSRFNTSIFSFAPLNKNENSRTQFAQNDSKLSNNDAGNLQNTPEIQLTPQQAQQRAYNNELQAFYKEESKRQIHFVKPQKGAPPFDLIVLHICSLSWEDLNWAQQRSHPLFGRFDALFTRFNSAASYSGPSALRVLRGTCGQTSHQALYNSTNPSCYVFPSLEQIGFKTQALLNHTGSYDEFAQSLVQRGGFGGGKLLDNRQAIQHMQAFDGTPIYDDALLLSQWWKSLQKQEQTTRAPVALYYNSISLHDGNRWPGSASRSSLDTYKPRLQKFLDDLNRFIQELEQSNRPVVLLLIPEHGAALQAGHSHVAGLREIPGPDITYVPAAIKLIGLPQVNMNNQNNNQNNNQINNQINAFSDSQNNINNDSKLSASDKDKEPKQTLRIDQPISYFGLFSLLADLLENNPYAANTKPFADRLKNLPETEFVSENSDLIVMKNAKKEWILREKEGFWTPYSN